MKLIAIEKQKFDDLVFKIDKIFEKIDTKTRSLELDGIWLTTREASKALQVTPRTLQNYRDRGTIPFTQFGKEIRYRAEDIQQFLVDHYVKPLNWKGGVS